MFNRNFFSGVGLFFFMSFVMILVSLRRGYKVINFEIVCFEGLWSMEFDVFDIGINLVW